MHGYVVGDVVMLHVQKKNEACIVCEKGYSAKNERELKEKTLKTAKIWRQINSDENKTKTDKMVPNITV